MGIESVLTCFRLTIQVSHTLRKFYTRKNLPIGRKSSSSGTKIIAIFIHEWCRRKEGSGNVVLRCF